MSSYCHHNVIILSHHHHIIITSFPQSWVAEINGRCALVCPAPPPTMLHITPIVLNIVLYHTIGIILVSVFHFCFPFSVFWFLFSVFCSPFPVLLHITLIVLNNVELHHTIGVILVSVFHFRFLFFIFCVLFSVLRYITPILLNIVKKTSYNRHHPHFCFQFSVFFVEPQTTFLSSATPSCPLSPVRATHSALHCTPSYMQATAVQTQTVYCTAYEHNAVYLTLLCIAQQVAHRQRQTLYIKLCYPLHTAMQSRPHAVQTQTLPCR